MIFFFDDIEGIMYSISDKVIGGFRCDNAFIYRKIFHTVFDVLWNTVIYRISTVVDVSLTDWSKLLLFSISFT